MTKKRNDDHIRFGFTCTGKKVRVCKSRSACSVNCCLQRKFEAIWAARTLRESTWWGQCCEPWWKNFASWKRPFRLSSIDVTGGGLWGHASQNF